MDRPGSRRRHPRHALKGKIIDGEHPPTYLQSPIINAVAFSRDGQWLAVTGYHEVLLHKADGTGLVARLVGLSERLQSLAFSPDGKYLAVTGGDPGRFGNGGHGQEKAQAFDSHHFRHRLRRQSQSPDGKLIAFGCSDNSVVAVEAETGKQVLYQGGHNDWVLDTVFSKTGSFLISVSRDRSMKLTEVATQRLEDNITSITPGGSQGRPASNRSASDKRRGSVWRRRWHAKDVHYIPYKKSPNRRRLQSDRAFPPLGGACSQSVIMPTVAESSPVRRRMEKARSVCSIPTTANRCLPSKKSRGPFTRRRFIPTENPLRARLRRPGSPP